MATMTEEPQAIEVEVLEIDGAAPPAKVETGGQFQSRQPWEQWQGRIRQLDARWWPLWVFLGIIALALMLTVGVVLGVIFLIFRIIRGFLRMLVG
jgi:hypothetical protein